MKKLLLLSFFAMTSAFCQSTKTVKEEIYKDNINKAFVEYNNHILNQEFEKSMEFMLPEFFEIIPKSQMILLMKQTYNNPDIEFEMDKPKDILIGDVKKIEGKYYSKINYSFNIKMKFNNTEKSDVVEENKLTQNLMKLTLEKSFGTGNVKFDEQTEFYDIHSIKDAYGVSIDGESDWKFVIVEKKQKFILEKILPKELTENL